MRKYSWKRKRRQTLRDYGKEITRRAETLHKKFYNASRHKKSFRGPSLYFHQRALSSGRLHDFKKQLEYIYATLASWGMHRMGKGGAKMVDFQDFEKSITKVKQQINQAKSMKLTDIKDDNWLVLKNIFDGIKVMESEAKLVGHSKVMAHLLPNLVPPIDREHTLKFLRKSHPKGKDAEWKLMRNLLKDFFIPIAGDEKFPKLAQRWLNKKKKFPWDTSIPKIIDNLVIAAAK
jgi:hypothetical protein